MTSVENAPLVLLRKEIRETLRDRSLVLNLILVPLFLYPMLGFGAFQVIQIIDGVAQRSKPTVVVAPSVPSVLRDSLSVREEIAVKVDAEAIERIRAANDTAQTRAAWRSSGSNVAVVLDWTGAAQDTAVLYHDGSRDRSQRAKDVVSNAIEDWKASSISSRAQQQGLAESEIRAWAISEEDTSSALERGKEILSMVLPITLILMLTMGTYYSALDTIVGERERGTFESLLTSPLTRGQILLGKFYYVVLASLVSLFLNLISLTIFLTFLLQLIPSTTEIWIDVEPAAFFIILAASVLAGAFFAAIFMVAASSAKTYREGQSALLPYYFSSIILGLTTATTRDALTMKQALIPVVNVVSLFKSVLRGEYPVGPILTVFVVLGALAAAAILFASRIGAREDAPWGTRLKIWRLRKEAGA
jgi:sodium transport system permease protein